MGLHGNPGVREAARVPLIPSPLPRTRAASMLRDCGWLSPSAAPRSPSTGASLEEEESTLIAALASLVSRGVCPEALSVAATPAAAAAAPAASPGSGAIAPAAAAASGVGPSSSAAERIGRGLTAQCVLRQEREGSQGLRVDTDIRLVTDRPKRCGREHTISGDSIVPQSNGPTTTCRSTT
jgi:hypothetical protein